MARLRWSKSKHIGQLPVRGQQKSRLPWEAALELEFQALIEIGAAGFEPTTPTTPKWCATKLRYAPAN
jgi:hypothetical protein